MGSPGDRFAHCLNEIGEIRDAVFSAVDITIFNDLSGSSHVSVVKQSNCRAFALSRKRFRPWSKALSTKGKNLFDQGRKVKK